MYKEIFINNVVDYEKVLQSLRGRHVVFDTETVGLSFEAPVIGFAFYDIDEKKAYWIPTDAVFEGLPYDKMMQISAKYFADLKVIGHNIKYDFGVLKREGIPDPELIDDSSLMIHVYNPDLLKNLETRVKLDLHYEKKTYEDIIGKKWSKVDWDEDVKSGLVNNEEMGRYAMEDVYWTHRLRKHYSQMLTDNMRKLLVEEEYPLIYVLRDMYHRGIKIDTKRLQQVDDSLTKGIVDLTNKAHLLAGKVFNLNSSQQKAKILYEDMRLECTTRTAKGAPSTDKNALKELAAKGSELAQVLLDYNTLAKLQSAYTRSIPKLLNSDGRLRCSFHSDGAVTGRFSSSDPNLQNQPNHPDYPIRDAFVASSGNVLVCADLSQIEPRIMTHLSGDRKMRAIYETGGDIYRGIADELSITRQAAKVVQLAISYGLGPQSLAVMLRISEREAKNVINRYYAAYPEFTAWKDSVERYAMKYKRIYNMFGRVRWLEGAGGTDKRSHFSALRKAVNTTVQGSAADLIKIAMIKVAKAFKESGTGAELLLTVHDELLVECKERYAKQVERMLVWNMENAVKLSVPIKAESKIIRRWSEMKSESSKQIIINPQTELLFL